MVENWRVKMTMSRILIPPPPGFFRFVSSSSTLTTVSR